MLHPESRGELSLASADPAAPIRIKQNFMSTEREWQTLRAGVRLMRDIMSKPQHGAVHRRASSRPARDPTPSIDAAYPQHRDHAASPARHLQDGPAIATRRRWSIRSCACAASSGCA